MAYNLTISISNKQKEFIDEKKLSPSQLIQDKVNELMHLKPEEMQIELKEFKDKAMTKWQRAYWMCKTYEQKEELIKEFGKAIGYNPGESKNES